MVVRDKKGNLIHDLSPEEVVMTDSGAAVKISNLRFVSGVAQAAEATSGQPQAVRLVSLVFEHFDPNSARLARETAEEMLKVDTPAKLFFAVLQINHRLKLIQTYTSDRNLVRRAVAIATVGPRNRLDSETEAIASQVGAAGGLDQGQVAIGDVAMSEMLSKAIIDSDQNSRDMQARPALDSLRALAQSLGTQPGRKTIVYFSQGLPLTGASKDGLNALVNVASRSNVGFYVADMTGLTMASRTQAGVDMLNQAAAAGSANTQVSQNVSGVPANAPIPGTPQTGGPAGTSMATVRASDRIQDIGASDAQGSLIELAKRTGGFYIGDTNDLRRPARRMIEDLATYYEAAFVPTDTKFDGSFHALGVTVQRKGATVQARSGYLALPPGTPPDVQPFELPLLKSLSETEMSKAIEFHADLARFGPDPKGTPVAVIVEIPLSQFLFRQDTANKSFEVHPRILALLKNDQGQVVKKFSQDLPYHGASQALDQMKHGVYTFQRTFVGTPGTYRLEVAVEDALDQKIGTQRVGVKIAPLTGGTELSTVSLVQRYEALPDTSVATEAFRYQNSRVVPSLNRTIDKQTAQSITTFFVIYPDPKSSEKPKLEMEISLRGETLGRLPMELPATTAPGPIPYVASIPTGSLRPGPYEVTAIVTQGKETAEQQTSFVVDGPEMELAKAAKPVGSGGSGSPETEAPVADVPLQSTLSITRIENALRPSDEDQMRIIRIARERSLDYQNTLPDFTCIEVTNRWVDPRGQGKWQEKDSVTELLRYVEKHEDHKVIAVSGVKQTVPRAKLGGVFSSGEFGGLLKTVFDPESTATFTWKELATLGNQTCNVFSFHVDRKDSKYSLAHGPNGQTEVVVGFHGLIYVDANSYSVRRVSIEAENIPKTFLFQSSQISVDYDSIAVGDHDYMLPAAAQMLVRIGKRNLLRNDIRFTEHRRFGAEAKIKFN
jgi:VWFA-related protein